MSMSLTKTVFFPLCIASVIAAVSGFSHGWLDGRWVDKPNVEAIGKKLNELPSQFGDWVLVENQELPDSTSSILRCYGYTLQVYQNSKNGRRLSVAVLLGPRGPIAVHTPEVCYSGQGIIPTGKTTQEAIKFDADEHTFWRVSFQSKIDSKPELEAFYAWSDGGNWQAAANPRVWLTSRLYKIQLACQPTSEGEVSDGVLFLQQFLPNLQPLLVKAS